MNSNDLELLKQLCEVKAPSGEELAMRDWLLDYITANLSSWKVQPKLVFGDDFQDCLILIFGKPRTAVYAHMDSVGYTVGYGNELIKIGGPKGEEGTILVGEDSNGPIEGKLHYAVKTRSEDEDEQEIDTVLQFDREVDRGTSLTYKVDFRSDDKKVTTAYLDNRLGVLNALKLAETLENGAICFSAWEEVGGGSVGYLARYLYNEYGIKQALISDISWLTEGVKAEKGPVISMRDSGIPRKAYVNKIIELARDSNIPFQLEVESSGGSDGNALQKSPYPIDWCFVGAAEENVHMPNETAYLADMDNMFGLYEYIMERL
ncbi:MAG: aminopeptidase [Flavobacteriales bacterium]|nr:aminopeptidase [Flavobacteriales bacterium]